MAVITKNHVAKWGLRHVIGASSFGVITSLEKISDLMVQTETDESGAVCRAVPYDNRERIVFTVMASESTDKPEPGTQMSIDGKACWVQHSEVIEQNQAYKKIRVTAERYKNCDTLG